MHLNTSSAGWEILLRRVWNQGDVIGLGYLTLLQTYGMDQASLSFLGTEHRERAGDSKSSCRKKYFEVLY